LPSTIRELAREGAQTMVEYTVVLGVITLAIITTLGLMSGVVESLYALVVGAFS
jgi:Flp pilus assembly pilin Flp